MTKIWVLPVLLSATLMGTSLLGCAQTRPAMGAIHPWEPVLFPLAVQVDEDLLPLHKSEITQAINTWNTTIGMTVFEYQEINIETQIVRGVPAAPPDGHVIMYSMELGMAEDGDIILGLTARNFSHGFMNNCIVWLDDDLQLNEVYAVALHELGHVLGLQHDEEEASIMHPHPLRSSGDIMSNDIEYVQDMITDQVSP